VQALNFNTTGGNNTANGCLALNFNTTGGNNTANGCLALNSNTTGGNNTAVGELALYLNTTGNNNIALGYQAGYNLSAGDNNIYIGNEGNTSESGVIRIGTPGIHTQTILAGTVSVNVLQILGGSDLAEPFNISTKDIPKRGRRGD